MVGMTNAAIAPEEADTPETAQPVSTLHTALYGIVNLPTSVVGLPVAIYIPAFYSGNLGLSLAAVGVLMSLSRLTDVVTDPLIGSLSDRWKTRFGRRKPWMVAGTPLKVLSLWMLFVPDSDFARLVWSSLGGDLSSGISQTYFFVWISLLYLGFTLVDLPYRAWGAELSKDYDGRSRITGWREAFGYVGTLMSLIIPLVMAYAFSLTGASNALFFVAVAVVVLMPTLSLPALVAVDEPEPDEIERERIPMFEGLKIVFQNEPFRRLVICLFFFVGAITMTASMSFFYVKHVMEEPFERYTSFILAYYLSSTLAIPIWLMISARLGKHKTVVLGIAWLSLWSAMIPLLGPGDFWIFFVVMLLKGSAVGSLAFLPTSMAADIVDLDIAQTGEQRTGLFFSIWGMVNKFAVAIGVLLATTIAAWFGFDPAVTTNDYTAERAVTYLYSIIPAALACIALPLLWNYPLTRERQQEIRASIEAARSAS